MSRGHAALGLLALLFAAWACGTLSASSEEEPVDAGIDAAICEPPTCGGEGGTCGDISACGDTVHCGDCASPYTCNGGKCECETALSCATLGASCGTFRDPCRGDVPCGTCDAGMSCQDTTDSGFHCVDGGCNDEPDATTCNHKCKLHTNNCAHLVDCTSRCADGQLCGGGASSSDCGCPARPATLYQYAAGNGTYHCYGTADAQCPASSGWFKEGPVATLYLSYFAGELVTLYRCVAQVGAQSVFLVTTSSACDGPNAFTLQGPIAATQPFGSAPLCGARPIHRYVNVQTNDYILGFGPAPAGYSPIGDEFYAW
jgi:hypothetical protein